jgi:hypothetical protein
MIVHWLELVETEAKELREADVISSRRRRAKRTRLRDGKVLIFEEARYLKDSKELVVQIQQETRQKWW